MNPAVTTILDSARASGRTTLTAVEAGEICRAFGLPLPAERLAATADEAVQAADAIGYPVALKIVSSGISHKSDAGGVKLGLATDGEVRSAFDAITMAARTFDPSARIDGILVQQMAPKGTEVIIGAVSDPSFGKVMMFGLGGIFAEIIQDVTFALAPVTRERARAMLAEISGYPLLTGARGTQPADLDALAGIIASVSELVTEHPEIVELDLNPVMALPSGAVAVDARIVVGDAAARPPQHDPAEIIATMQRTMHPKSVAVIGASAEEGKIGHSVVRNLIDGGYTGALYPVNPKAPEIQGLKAYPSISDIPGDVDVAVFAIPAPLVPNAVRQAGEKGVATAVLIPSGFAEIGEVELQRQVV
ncbi:MAG TPA: acetate--CoA ligase family protein, partial [Tepidiformaceae bacterium]|nr:acetate--CoA ligase family protein [Tepidiformaceae bacterium]